MPLSNVISPLAMLSLASIGSFTVATRVATPLFTSKM